MKKYIGVFAHPDDEAFGPGGSFALWASKGAETHVLTATKGELGGQPGVETIRQKEMADSAAALGLKSQHFLGFKDGELRNEIYQQIAKKTAQEISKLVDKNTELTLVTFDRTGFTGHLDHIAMSMITTHIYAHRDVYLPKMKSCQLIYFCANDQWRPSADSTYFVFMPAGYTKAEIDIVNNISKFKKQKLAAIRSHKSQMPERYIQKSGNHLWKESFIKCKDVK